MKRSKPEVSKSALSVDILDNLKKFNILNQIETLIILVKNDRVSTDIIYEFSLHLESILEEANNVTNFYDFNYCLGLRKR